MPTGSIDNSVKLNMAERAEKVIKVGVVCVISLLASSIASWYKNLLTSECRTNY